MNYEAMMARFLKVKDKKRRWEQKRKPMKQQRDDLHQQRSSSRRLCANRADRCRVQNAAARGL